MSDNVENIDEPERSTGDRYQVYKAQQRAAGREPLRWGDWIAAGQPIEST